MADGEGRGRGGGAEECFVGSVAVGEQLKLKWNGSGNAIWPQNIQNVQISSVCSPR